LPLKALALSSACATGGAPQTPALGAEREIVAYPGASLADYLGQDCHGDLLGRLRADIETQWRVELCEPPGIDAIRLDTREHRLDPPTRPDHSDKALRLAQRRPYRLLVE